MNIRLTMASIVSLMANVDKLLLIGGKVPAGMAPPRGKAPVNESTHESEKKQSNDDWRTDSKVVQPRRTSGSV